MHNIGIDGRVLEAALRKRSLVITARKNGNAGTHESERRNPERGGPRNKGRDLCDENLIRVWIFAIRTLSSEAGCCEGQPVSFFPFTLHSLTVHPSGFA